MARLPSTIHTARLTLRPLGADDADALVEGIGNYSVIRWLSSPPYPYSRDHALAFVGDVVGEPVWAIDDGCGLRGVIGVGKELGYWLARECWGRGYATEAGDAAIDMWFSVGRAEVLRSNHYVGNESSAHVLLKLGFVDRGGCSIRSTALSQDVAARQMELTRARWQSRRIYRLRTRRLQLRELRDGDLAALRRIGGHPEVAPHIMVATVSWPEESARKVLLASKYRGRPGFRLAVRHWGRSVGFLGLGRCAGSRYYSIAYFFDPRVWGRGLATEAVGTFLSDAMARFDIPEIEAEHFEDNPASGAVLRKLGFLETGRGMARSAARLEAAPVVIYRLDRSKLKVPA